MGLKLAGVAFAVVSVVFLVLAPRIAVPREPSSPYSAAQQMTMQRWAPEAAAMEFLIAVVSAAAAVWCFAAAARRNPGG
jgi:hypothetical protein